MAGVGYTVEPDVLDNYASGLEGRAQQVIQSVDRVEAANGFDMNAFGLLVGQILGIPSRIALATLKDKLQSAADGTTSAAEKVRAAAKVYRETEGDHSKVLESINA